MQQGREDTTLVALLALFIVAFGQNTFIANASMRTPIGVDGPFVLRVNGPALRACAHGASIIRNLGNSFFCSAHTFQFKTTDILVSVGSNVREFAIPRLRQIFVALRFFQGVEQARRSQGDLVKSVFKMRFTQTKLKFKSVVCREALVPLTIQARHHKAAVVGGVGRIGRNRLLNAIDGLVFSQINTPRTAEL